MNTQDLQALKERLALDPKNGRIEKAIRDNVDARLDKVMDLAEQYLREEGKAGVKTYLNPKRAQNAISKVAEDTATFFGSNYPADFYLSRLSNGRWVGIVDLTEVLTRPERIGGYIGYVASKGHFSI